MASFHKYENKSGSFWEYRIIYKDSLSGKSREKSKKGFKTKGEAKLAAEEFERDLKDGFQEENILLKDFIYYWLDRHKKGNIRESTYENKEQQIRLHIVPFFQNIKLQDVKPMFYQGFIDHMAEQGYSRSTIENSHWILHSVFERAILERKIKNNPAKVATLKGKRKSEDEDLEFIPSSLINDILVEAYRDRFEYYMFFKTLVDTGMRKGEACGLTWDDIDFKNFTITVNKSMDTQKGKFSSTKTYHSKRTIAVPERLIQELMKLRRRQNENRIAWGDQYNYEMNLVFCRPKGEFYPKSTLFNALRRYQRKTGIFAGKKEDGSPSFYSIHSLRHTHAVICLENEMDMKTLQERLGHGSYEVTANVYSHVSDKMKKKTIEKYESGTVNIFAALDLEGVYN